MSDYESLFDQEVAQYAQWLRNPPKSRFFSFQGPRHPLYERKDLDGPQKDTIALASDLLRVDERLEKVIAGESEEMPLKIAKEGKQIVADLYEGYRQAYISRIFRV